MRTRWLQRRRAWRNLYSFPVDAHEPYRPTLTHAGASPDGLVLLQFKLRGLPPADRDTSVCASVTARGFELHDPDTCCFATADHFPVGEAHRARSLYRHLSAQTANPSFMTDLRRGIAALRTLHLTHPDHAHMTPGELAGSLRPFDLADTLLSLHGQPADTRRVALAILPTVDDFTSVVDTARAATTP